MYKYNQNREDAGESTILWEQWWFGGGIQATQDWISRIGFETKKMRQKVRPMQQLFICQGGWQRRQWQK